MEVRHGLGYQNYHKMMENNIFYIDKTDFIREWWECADEVTLITRPRRFGKTLNMSTVECFFSIKYKDRRDLFEGRKVWEHKELRTIQGTFPVIFMSFASVKSGRHIETCNEAKVGNISELTEAIKKVIADTYNEYAFIMEKDIYTKNEREHFGSVNDDMSDTTMYTAINRLCHYLEKYYGKKVIVLLDEYDTPMQEAWAKGFWDEAVEVFRNFFGSTFKTNKSLCRGLITGITRISKESIFSDLNHLKVVTTTSNEYAKCFGFTEEEVFEALDGSGLGEHKEGVKKWYDGFIFGNHADIYNPWSIVSFIKSMGRYEAYWANTSSNSLVSVLIRTSNIEAKKTVEDLLDEKSFQAPIDEQIVFSQLEGNINAVWSLLVASGYLKIIDSEPLTADRKGKPQCTMKLTNTEVLNVFEDMVRSWFAVDVSGSAYNDFVKAMLLDDVEFMNEFMNEIALNSFSSFDAAKNAASEDHPERFYHGFVLGLIVGLRDRFEITSNRESGFGRYDVVLNPRDRERDNAYIIEFKVFRASRERTLKDTVATALAQIEEKQYENSLITNGIPKEKIRKYGFAFQGKKCLIGTVYH